MQTRAGIAVLLNVQFAAKPTRRFLRTSTISAPSFLYTLCTSASRPPNHRQRFLQSPVDSISNRELHRTTRRCSARQKQIEFP
jgi:hypothetical protein